MYSVAADYGHTSSYTALCPDPDEPVNGVVTFTGNSMDDTATYTCNMGFELVGSATATCTLEEVAAFFPEPPQCRRKLRINVIGVTTCVHCCMEETLNFLLLCNAPRLQNPNV